MWQSSEENKTEEKTPREQLAAKERRRLQNRIAQRNHRKKKAQLNGNEEQKLREGPNAHADVQVQPSNNIKYNEHASDEDPANVHGSLALSHAPPFGKACRSSNIHDHYRHIPAVWQSDNQIINHSSRSSQQRRRANEICSTSTTLGNLWRDQDIPQNPSGVTRPQFSEDVGNLSCLVTNSPDLSAAFDGTDSDIGSPAAQSYSAALATIEPCPPLSSAQTSVSEDDLGLIGVPPGWPGNIFGPPKRLRSYSENTGRIAQSSPFLMHLESHSEPEKCHDDSEGKMALHLSAENGHANIVRCLLEFGSDINKRDGSGASALHYAAGTGNVEVISILLEKGADGNTVDLQGRTPLHIAAERGHEAAVRILIQSGARVDIQIQRNHVSNRYNT
ncbi:26S proteasome non-ATPase regulatory subunit 10 [Histoplasma capsulatum G186AR]|uniref:26S proteasome non-ATPase regulatory subunit 10 n=2 Tax=Ajellomyces capsulatus TaxID=5037 RepID=C0NKZ6_AJECG|nr:26S proteasome non-ATPase regulatory subunit 10 [Histoplasma capsulatum G186AR]EEH08537.1 26S proteasome non-ATPase regulatory subunit 10 [Histoplasma capsulatum G186AR]KAG5299151.1 26S proteasome non-ATPase regulatory subunit 10 [Histoplasma capsulatum]QSS68229.1 26S proteasome non-ATPase regulatory subunit 10 [Histoplasma capsulatum G186AR]